MSRVVKALLIALWIVVFSMAFAAIWIRSPILWALNLPEPAWEYLSSLFGATCCESVADLEVAVGILFGILFALIFLGLATLCSKTLKRFRSHSSESVRARR